MTETGFPGVPGGALMPEWYGGLLEDVAARVSAGNRQALRAVNTQMLATYWDIGRDILQRQNNEGWGAGVIDRLSADLKNRFPDVRGFSPRNLRYMRTLAEVWERDAILQQDVAELPWGHHLKLLGISDPETRRWYAKRAVAERWSRDVLSEQIQNRLHARAGQAVTNFAQTIPAEESDVAQQMTRDPYLFGFLGQIDARREHNLENALASQVSRFLLELGQGFAFVGQQMRLVINDTEFFCDLLFYNVPLHRYVVIELKAAEFKPEYLGQLGMYQAAVDDLLAGENDSPTLGLLLCRSKDNVVAEYALRAQALPTGVAEWQTELTHELTAELAAKLPTVEELEAELSAEPWNEV